MAFGRRTHVRDDAGAPEAAAEEYSEDANEQSLGSDVEEYPQELAEWGGDEVDGKSCEHVFARDIRAVPIGEGGAGESEDGAGPAWGIAEAIEDKEEEESGEEADEATGDGGAGFELAESGFEIAELEEERIW